MTPLADEHERIWLAPKCHDSGSEGRLWCQDRLPDCDEIGCENPSVEYVRADIADTRCEAEAAEARAEVERLKALKTPRPQWFYLAGDMSSDKCRFGVHEVIDEDWLWDNRAEGSAVVQIETATPCPDIWCAVRFFTDVEKDERASDDDYEFSEHATEEEARQALNDHRSSTDA